MSFFVKHYFIVEDRETGLRVNAFPQAVDLHMGEDTHYELRWNIGINNYLEWTSIHCIYDNDQFNKKYKVIAEINN